MGICDAPWYSRSKWQREITAWSIFICARYNPSLILFISFVWKPYSFSSENTLECLKISGLPSAWINLLELYEN